jgi:hypothetical protein
VIYGICWYRKTNELFECNGINSLSKEKTEHIDIPQYTGGVRLANLGEFRLKYSFLMWVGYILANDFQITQQEASRPIQDVWKTDNGDLR